MKTKLFLIAAILVLASMFALVSCNNDSAGTTDPDAALVDENDKFPLSKYDVDGAEMSSPESRTDLEEACKAIQVLYNECTDIAASNGGEQEQLVKDLGAEIVNLINNKIANTEYSKYEAFVKDAIKEIDRLSGALKEAMNPSAAPAA